MAKFVVTAQVRPGFNHVVRAGRFWPAGQGVTVELVDGEDPQILNENKNGPKMVPHPGKLNRAALDAVMNDGRLSVRQEGMDLGGTGSARTEVAAAKDRELLDAKASLLELTKKFEDLGERFRAVSEKASESERAAAQRILELEAKLAQAEADLAELTAPAPSPDKGKGNKPKG